MTNIYCGGFGDDCRGDTGRRNNRNTVHYFGQSANVGVGGKTFYRSGVRIDWINRPSVMHVATQDFVAVLIAIARSANHRMRPAREKVCNR